MLRGARQRRETAPGEPRNVAWLYVLPGFVAFLLFTLLPLLHTVELSFYDWDGLTAGKFIGFQNYTDAFNDPLVRDSFRHAAVLIVFYAVIPVLLGLLLTALLTRYPVRGFTFYRTALFLPQMIAGVVVAQAWSWIYAENGPFNSLLERDRARLLRPAVARLIHMGAPGHGGDRHLGDLRPVHGAVHRRGPEDSPGPV